MTKKTVNLVMVAANDSGNGCSKTYFQFEDGTNTTSVTPSIYSPISGQSIPELDEDSNLEELDNNMDVIIKSPIIRSSSEYLIGNAATNSNNTLTGYNIESNVGKSDTDITIIIPIVKIAYSALKYVLIRTKNIPSMINVNLTHYLTCLPISEFRNEKKRELLKKKFCKGKHTVIIKNFKKDIKVVISFNSDNTMVYPEGILAQFGLIYAPDNYPNFRHDNLYKDAPFNNGKDYSNSGNTLLIDIGDGTTDISIISGTHLVKGAGVNVSLNQGVGTAAAAASDALAIDFPQLGHYSRSIFLEHALRNSQEGKILRNKYLEPQIDLLVKAIETEVEKEYRRINNDINTVIVLGGGVNLFTAKNRSNFQKIIDDLNPFDSHQKIWWVDSDHNQLLNLDGLRIFLARQIRKNK